MWKKRWRTETIKVSNIGSISKTGSRFVAIRENLKKFGLDFDLCKIILNLVRNRNEFGAKS